MKSLWKTLKTISAYTESTVKNVETLKKISISWHYPAKKTWFHKCVLGLAHYVYFSHSEAATNLYLIFFNSSQSRTFKTISTHTKQCCGSESTWICTVFILFILLSWIRIRIRDGNAYPDIFQVKIQLFVTSKVWSGSAWMRIGLASWIRIRIRTEIKSWIWIRIRIETNEDSQHGDKIHGFFGESTKILAWIVAEGRFLECAVAAEVGWRNNKRHLFRILLEVSVPQVPHRRGANFRFEFGWAVPAQKRFVVTFWFKFSRGVKHFQKLVLWISIRWIYI